MKLQFQKTSRSLSTNSRARVCCALIAVACAGVSRADDATEKKTPGKPEKAVLEKKEPASAKPVTRPAGGKKNDPAQAALGNAVKKLSDEYRAFLKDPNAALPRTTSDYFTKSPDPAVTGEAVFKALEKSHTGDARIDAYVKWQLLSALPPTVDDADVPRLLRVYNRAPLPPAFPGKDRQTLGRALQQAQPSVRDNESVVNQQFGTAVTEYGRQTASVIGYRDELFSKLPSRADCIAAGWNDVRERVAIGISADSFGSTVTSATRGWAVSTATPEQISAMIGLVQQVVSEAENRETQPYTNVTWDERNQQLMWRPAMRVNGGELKDLIESLRENQSAPGGGIRVRDK